MRDGVTNVVFAGLGGLGVLRASDILADAAFRSGFDVKKSEIHGMSQRGGSVSSDVRYGAVVYSPMVPEGTAEYLVVLHPTQVDVYRYLLCEDGVLLTPASLLGDSDAFDRLDQASDGPVTRRNLNVALLGLLSTRLDLGDDVWHEAIRANLPAKVFDQNVAAFQFGRSRGADLYAPKQ